MPDEQGAGAPHDDNQQPTEGQQQDAGASATQTTTTPETKQDSANQLIKQFVKDRGITVEDLLGQITAKEDADKTELQKVTGERDALTAEINALRTEIRESRAEAAFVEAATKANARAPKTLFRAYKSDLEYDDDGTPTNLADIIAKVQDDEPALFLTPEGDGGKGSTGVTTGSSMNNLFRDLRATHTRK